MGQLFCIAVDLKTNNVPFAMLELWPLQLHTRVPWQWLWLAAISPCKIKMAGESSLLHTAMVVVFFFVVVVFCVCRWKTKMPFPLIHACA